MKSRKIFFILSAVSVLFYSCSDDSNPGPTGVTPGCLVTSYVDPLEISFRRVVEYNSEGKPTEIKFFDENTEGSAFARAKITYNAQGSLSRMDVLEGDFLYAYIEYVSNNSGLVISSQEFTFTDEDTFEANPLGYFIYRYDNEKRLKEKVLPPNQYNSDSIRFRHSYNSQGNRSAYTAVESGNESVHRTFSSYDTKTNFYTLSPVLQFIHEDYSLNNPTAMSIEGEPRVFEYEYDAENSLPVSVAVQIGPDLASYAITYDCK
ncbi:MAG TPA: hypothetical protein VD884_23685 [Ohtaekwangia sp.]|nr:hypothetical protein [Ohtaekwangia sp.]